jgi:alcohol dehydrogenase class IV
LINKQMFQFPIIYTMPINRIAIGWGVHETVADECKQAGIKKALITTTGLKGTGIIDEINQILTGNGVATEIYDKITSNPKDHEVTEAYQVFKNAECDGVVSVGGGSSHDCGKCVRILAANEGKNIYDFVMSKDVPWMEKVKTHNPATLPQITVNTTAGTSAESTCAAMFNDTKSGTKAGIISPSLAPTVALVDPLLVRLMPQNIAAWTGFDAFAHAFEGYISRLGSRYTAAISLAIIKLVAENLREFTHNRMNHVACENMCWASNMSVALLHFGGSVGIVHGIGHQFSALFDCHHGRANAIGTLVLERANEAACPDKFAEMAGAMGVDTRGMTKMQAADKWFDEVERLLKDLNIKSGNLNKQLGIQKKDLKDIAKIYSGDFSQEGNPRDIGYDECLKLLEDML